MEATRCATGELAWTFYPPPSLLEATSLMVNGVAAPLFLYDSHADQLPDALERARQRQVVVNNQAVSGTRALRVSQPHTATPAAVDPGLFVTDGRRAAALNGDLSVHTSATPIPAGGYVILFLTGAGPLTPAAPDGTVAPSALLSIINGTVQVSFGGQNATLTYQGIPAGFAGLEQLNVVVPAGLTAGDQPVLLTFNGVPNHAAVITVK
ncbi:MAG TPA: hypothetical protein VKB88_16590 [Bryobacteraceae bacterium]|nr:hypothetical protein [Bryobacteraceae bacterium]